MARAPRKAPDKINTFISGLMRNIEATYPDESHLIWQAWPVAVGPEIAERTELQLFRDGQLTVAVSSAPWVQQLSLMAPQLIEALNEQIGKALVESLRFRLATVAPPPKPPEVLPDWKDEELDKDDAEEAHELAANIGDNEISDAIERARLMALKRRKYLHRQGDE
jgi:hypothetical protein